MAPLIDLDVGIDGLETSKDEVNLIRTGCNVGECHWCSSDIRPIKQDGCPRRSGDHFELSNRKPYLGMVRLPPPYDEG